MKQALALAVALNVAVPAFAADDVGTSSSAVFDFLTAKIAGHTVATEGTTMLDGGHVRTQYSTHFKISGLMRTESGFVWQEISDVKQSRQDVGADGQPTGPVIKSDRIVVSRCEAKPHPWSGARLIGFCQIASNSFVDATGTVETVVAELQGDQLVMAYRSPTPRDCYATKDTKKPCLSTHTYTFSLTTAGKVHVASESFTYDADPMTFAQGAQMSANKTEFVEE